MHTGRTVFSQLLDFLPKKQFDRCVRRDTNLALFSIFLTLFDIFWNFLKKKHQHLAIIDRFRYKKDTD